MVLRSYAAAGREPHTDIRYPLPHGFTPARIRQVHLL